MITEINKKVFFENYFKITGVVLTRFISDCDKIYIDDKNRYYSSTNYAEGECITAFQPYNLGLYNKILTEFPDAVNIEFIYNGYADRESINNFEDECFFYDYKFQGILNTKIAAEQPFAVKLITENDIELAKQYDDLYLSSLPPKHGVRMTNQIKRDSLKNGKFKLYFAYIKDIPIGHILAYLYPEYNAWSFAYIMIEEDYKQKGYGAAFLSEVTKDNLKEGYGLYCTSVEGINIASRKTAEKVGYTIVTSRLSVSVK